MVTAKLSAKSQITLPRQVRQALDVKPGERVVFTVAEGSVVLHALGASGAKALAGSLSKYARGRAPAVAPRGLVKKEVARAAAREQ